jgi:hypothetical protein
MEERHIIAQELNEKQRYMYHQLGAKIQSIKSRGRQYDANQAHQDALWALDQVSWKSMKAAMALLQASRML